MICVAADAFRNLVRAMLHCPPSMMHAVGSKSLKCRLECYRVRLKRSSSTKGRRVVQGIIIVLRTAGKIIILGFLGSKSLGELETAGPHFCHVLRLR
jgi:hypothetical protein